ncbi:MAG TPA: hypothetical protein VHH15_07630 [Actinophytocola sp.]|nr:hypothetical protein [Actinophytocola sp.]
MRSMDVTARNFVPMLEAVDQGEEVVLTRDGVPVAHVVPGRPSPPARIDEVMTRVPVDPGRADDLEATVRESRTETDEQRARAADRIAGRCWRSTHSRRKPCTSGNARSRNYASGRTARSVNRPAADTPGRVIVG